MTPQQTSSHSGYPRKRPQKHILLIDSVESLYPLHQEIRRGRWKRFKGLQLAVPQFTEDENKNWQEQVEKFYFNCGCAEGAIFGTASLITLGIWAFVRPQPPDWKDCLPAVVIFFLSVGLGKFIGLRFGKSRLKRTIAELQQHLEKRGAHRAPTVEEKDPELPHESYCAVGKGGNA